MSPIIVPGCMSTYDWLLFLHVTGAFLLTGGVLVAITFNLVAQLRQKPSEIALLLGLTRFAVAAIVSGGILTLAFGLWLVDETPFGYGYGQGWVIAAIVLWVIGNAMGSRAGKREEQTRELATRLAGEGDMPSAELKAQMRDPLTLFLSYGTGVVILALLAVMIWKPGA
jgi:uncharacterized membrane protein